MQFQSEKYKIADKPLNPFIDNNEIADLRKRLMRIKRGERDLYY